MFILKRYNSGEKRVYMLRLMGKTDEVVIFNAFVVGRITGDFVV